MVIHNFIKFYNLMLSSFYCNHSIIFNFDYFSRCKFCLEKEDSFVGRTFSKYLVISDYPGPKVYAKLVLNNAAINSLYSRRRSFSKFNAENICYHLRMPFIEIVM